MDKPALLQRVLPSGGFVRAVLILVGGTAFAHAITALALPVLTRLYSPDHFSTLAVFASLLSIVSVAACLRFDIAIPLPDKGREAFNLVLLALGCATVVALLSALFVFVAPGWIAHTLGRAQMEPFLWLVPVGIMLGGTYSALQNWFVREKQFHLIARSRVMQSSASAGTQIAMSGLASAPFGLLVGYLLNTGAACVGLGYRFMRSNGHYLRDVRYADLRKTMFNYRRFPKFSTWEALCNSASIQVPMLMISAMAAGPEVGHLLLAMSVIQAPMALFGVAIGQVYLAQASNEHRNGRLGSVTAEILGGLIRSGVGPLLFLGIISPLMFGVLFGKDWLRAGWLVAWMTPWFVMQFLAAPLSMALHVTGNQKTAFALQVFGLILRVFMVWGASFLSIRPLSEAYAISGALFYVVYLWLILRCVESDPKELMKKLITGSRSVGLWLVFGVALAVAGKLLFFRE